MEYKLFFLLNTLSIIDSSIALFVRIMNNTPVGGDHRSGTVTVEEWIMTSLS